MSILPPGHLHRGGIHRHHKYTNGWIVSIVIDGKPYRKYFTDFQIASVLHRALVRLKEYYYAKKTLEYWGLQGEMEEVERNNFLVLTKEEYKDMSKSRRQVLIDLYNCINQRLENKTALNGSRLGRKPILGPQEDFRIQNVKEKWREKLISSGYLKKQKEYYDPKENKFRE